MGASPELSGGTRNLGVQRKMTLREKLLVIYFAACLYPIGVGPLSVNYAFVLLPLYVVARDRLIRRPPPLALIAIGIFTGVFIIASIYQVRFLDDALRRLVSFVLFMSMFSYMVIQVDDGMVRAFKVALIAISVLLSLSAIYTFVTLGGSALGFEAKDVVGSQRIGFIYLMALWVTYLEERRGRLAAAAVAAIMMVLLAGLLLTFSRSSVVALLGSFGAFGLVRSVALLRRLRARQLMGAMGSVVKVGAVLVAIGTLFPVTLDFFQERLYTFMLQSDAVSASMANPEASEGTRIYLAKLILSFVRDNPMTGSGYLGVWVVTGDFSGSAHSQYTDVLFRTGVLGFVAYLALVVAVLVHLWGRDQGLFWGLVGILIYGLFHETFKESQGACVLAFLLGMTAVTQRRRAFSRIATGALVTAWDGAPGGLILADHTRQRGRPD